MSAFPSGRERNVTSATDDDRERAERVAGDRENARGPQIEDVLRVRDLRSRDRGLERHGERDAEREPDVDERDRLDPSLSHEKE